MPITRLTAVAFALVAAGIAFAASTPTQPREYISHTVARGESVSLICIKYYGRYSEELAASIRQANPNVADINKVKPGMAIKLRKPISPKDPVRAELPAEEVVVFEQRVQAQQGVITMAAGAVKLTRGGQTRAAGTNTIVEPGDAIETGADGRAEIIINRESVVRLKENTRVSIDAMHDAAVDKGKTQVGFSLGTVWTKVRSAKDKICRFELELPTAIAGVHGTVYQTTVGGDKSAEVKVYDGEVSVNGQKPSHAGPVPEAGSEVAGPEEVPGPHEVSMDEWVQIVRSMQRIAIDTKGAPSSPAQFKRQSSDEWEKFNEERDRQINVIIAVPITMTE